MKVFLNLIFLLFTGCSLINKKVNIEQVKDRKDSFQNINSEHLIMQEKQSLSIAILQIEHQNITNDSVVIAEAKSLIYTSDNEFGLKLNKSNLLPEAIELFTSANNHNLTTIVLCKNSAEENTIKTLLKDKLKKQYLVKYSYTYDLMEFKNKKPVVIISEDFDSLWGRSSDNIPSKKLWYSRWVPLQNSQKSKISKDDWIKFLL